MQSHSEAAATPPGEAAAVTPERRRKRAQALLLLGLAVVVFALDQLSKNWVVANLPEGETVPVLGGFLQWHFVRNPGAAFSMATGATWVFTLLAVVVVGVILWQVRRLGSRSWATFLALLLGGVLGNLTDRLTREPGFPEGHVIDFILTPWMWLGFNPAIYNVADMAIVVAMGLFILISLRGVPIDGSPRQQKSGDDLGDAEHQNNDGSDGGAPGGAPGDENAGSTDGERSDA